MDNTYEIPDLTGDASEIEARNPYVSVDKPRDHMKPRKVKPIIYVVVVQAVISVVMLIFMAVVSWKLVSLDKALEEERQARNLPVPLNVSNADNGGHTIFDRTELRSMIEKNTKQIEWLGQKFEGLFSVAFYATFRERFLYVTVGEKMKFDNVRLNKGNGYDGTTGVFMAPESGLYYFSMHVFTDDKKYLALRLKRNDHNILCGFQEENTSDSEDGTGSCSETVELNTADRINVEVSRATDSNSIDCSHDDYGSFCGFTGFMMKPY